MNDGWTTRKSLILRARDPDDKQAWEEFVQYYERFIFQVLHRMNVSSSDFDDLVQNVLLRLWRHLASYDPEQGRFRAWLGVVVRNAVYDQFKEIKKRGELLNPEMEFMQKLESDNASEIERLIEQEWAQYVTSLALQRIESLFSIEAVKSFTMSSAGASAKTIAAELDLEPVVLATDDDDFGPVLDWMTKHLAESFTLGEIADHFAMSLRTFQRRFQNLTGYAPLTWVNHNRVTKARGMLEATELTIEQVAHRSGLGSTANMRKHFDRVLGTTPSAYRSAFRSTS